MGPTDRVIFLPPIGQITEENHDEVVQYLNNLENEALDDREMLEPGLDLNMAYYHYGQATPPLESDIVVNEIQNAIIAITDIQTKDPPRPLIEPVETGEPPLYFWAGPPEVGASFKLLPQQLGPTIDEVGNAINQLPIDPITAGMLKAVSYPEEVAPQLLPGMIRPDWLAEVSDATVAEVYQLVMNVYWDRSESDLSWRQNLLDTNVQGWAIMLTEFDAENERFINTHIPPKHALIDPLARSVREAAYLGIDIPKDANEAIAQFPHLAPMIEDKARTGNLAHPSGRQRLASRFQRTFQRPMVNMRIWWLRHQQAPMNPEEAVAKGLVLENQALETEITGDGGLPTLSGTIYTLAADGQEVEVGGKGWPMRSVIRQITQIEDVIVDDRENEHWDIPVVWNVNIPHAGNSPYGIGEPQRLWSLQMSLSRMLEAMIEHTDYYRAPIVSISQSMAKILGQDRINMGVEAGLVIVVPDDQYAVSQGQPVQVVNPPPLPEAMAAVFPMLQNLTSEISGNTEILQGRGSANASSGVAIEMLQSAATSMIGFKSKRTADAIRWDANCKLYNIIWRLEVEQIKKVFSKWPDNILASIVAHARASEWNVEAQVQYGTGSVMAQKRAMALEDLTVQAITLQTYRERVGIDHNTEEKRREAAIARESRYAGASMAPPGEGENPGDKQSGGGDKPGNSRVGGGKTGPKDQQGGESVPQP